MRSTTRSRCVGAALLLAAAASWTGCGDDPSSSRAEATDPSSSRGFGAAVVDARFCRAAGFEVGENPTPEDRFRLVQVLERRAPEQWRSLLHHVVQAVEEGTEPDDSLDRSFAEFTAFVEHACSINLPDP